MKKRFRKLKKKLRPLLLIPIVLLALMLVGGYFLFFAGDDDSDETASPGQSPASATGNGSDDETTTLTQPKAPQLEADQPAAGKEFTIDSDRDEKEYAIAQASGSISAPASIALRIGAAPKQPVVVNVSITCTQPSEAAKANADTFSVTPPNTRQLKLPVSDPVSCIATGNAQLTRAGRGRIKVFLVGTRRVEE